MPKPKTDYWAVLVDGHTCAIIFDGSSIKVTSITSRRTQASHLKDILQSLNPKSKVTIQKVSVVIFP